MKERIHYLDIAKGILILCLMLSHFGSAIRRLDLENEWFKLLLYFTPFFACFFMQCFFIISGFCSNFKGRFTDFIKKQIRQIVIPWVAFEVIGVILSTLFWGDLRVAYSLISPPNTTLWFFSALLISKLYCYIIINYIKSNGFLLGGSLLLLFLALIINQYNILPNLFAFKNALAACFFVSVGYVLKAKGLSNRLLVCGTVVYILSIFMLKMFKLPLPVLDAGVSNVSWKFFPVILVITLSGSLGCLLFCKLLNKNCFLEYFGRNSIVVYGLHFVPLLCCVKFYTHLIIPNGVMSMLLMAFLIYGTLLVFLILLIKLFNTKYFKWIIGR